MGRKSESEFEKLMADVRGKHSKRINAILLTQGQSEEEAFAVNYFKLLEYASPKLQRSEIIEETKEQKITIEHAFRKKEEPKD